MAKIMMDDIEILRGDRQSIAVIYNNLTGKNFEDKKEYQQYLAGREKALGMKIIPDKLQLKEL